MLPTLSITPSSVCFYNVPVFPTRMPFPHYRHRMRSSRGYWPTSTKLAIYFIVHASLVRLQVDGPALYLPLRFSRSVLLCYPCSRIAIKTIALMILAVLYALYVVFYGRFFKYFVAAR